MELDGAMVYIILQIISNTTALLPLWVFSSFFVCFGVELKPRVSRI